MASTDTAEDNNGFAEKNEATFPILTDKDRSESAEYGVLSGTYARRWTYYIGADGKVLAIDKEVKPASSAQDIASKLGELGVAKR